MTTFGDRADELLRDPTIAPLADRLVKRLAAALDPVGTDESGEAVEDVLRDRLRGMIADAAVRNGWRLP